MPREKIFYYDPRYGINREELLDVVRSVQSNEWSDNGIRFGEVDPSFNPSYIYGDYSYGNKKVRFGFSGVHENPIGIAGTNIREINRVKSKLTKILKIGKLDKIAEGEVAKSHLDLLAE